MPSHTHHLTSKTNRRDCCTCYVCLGFLLSYSLLVHMEMYILVFILHTQLEREYRAVALWNWDMSLILIQCTLPVLPASLSVFTLLTSFYSYHTAHVIKMKVFFFKCASRKPTHSARSRAQLSTGMSEMVTCHLDCDWYVDKI